MPQQKTASSPARWVVTDREGLRTEVIAERYDTTGGELEFFNRNGTRPRPDQDEVVATYAPGAWTRVNRESGPFVVIDIPDGLDPDDIEAQLIDHLTWITTKE